MIGMLAMMPAFATDDAVRADAVNTVDVGRLERGVKRLLGDGVDVIAAAGSFGEGYALQREELRALALATVQAAAKRVPVFVGCLGLNTREIVARARIVQESKADGLLLGLPSYFPQTVENAVNFYEEVAGMFPTMPILLYHNPLLFRTALPIAAFERLAKVRNIVGMKDSHRDTRAFIELEQLTKDHISIFVGAWQYFPYAQLGAAGFWSYHCWMGPAPLLLLREAITSGDNELARALTLELTTAYEGPEPPDVRWRETQAKVAIRHAGYVNPGPLRHPFVEIPKTVDESALAFAKRWKKLCEKYDMASASKSA